MPFITLTSDFGIQNHALASVKGRILASFPDAVITDISHTIQGQNVQQAVYLFRQAYRHFPERSFHFVLNDLYATRSRKLLYAFENNQHIFCADNGFLTMLFDDQPLQIYQLTEPLLHYNFIHITDLFLSAASMIQHGVEGNRKLISVSDIMIKHPVKAYYSNGVLEAHVLYIDDFGNVVLNVNQQQFEEARNGRRFRILFMRDEEINTLSEHYNDVEPGEKLCIFNTAGYLEIAVNRGNAAGLFGFEEKNERNVFYNTIKLFFE